MAREQIPFPLQEATGEQLYSFMWTLVAFWGCYGPDLGMLSDTELVVMAGASTGMIGGSILA